jgi:hypothetical protein
MKNTNLEANEIAFIREAQAFLEKPSLVIKFTNMLGRPIEMGLKRLPDSAQKKLANITQNAVEKALQAAAKTIPPVASGSFQGALQNSSETALMHKIGTTLTGAVGGFFGFAGMAVELPITTVIMLRSISSIAAEYGHDINDFNIRLECLAVFAMGSPSEDDDAIDSAYFSSRIAMAELISQWSRWATHKTAQEIAQAVAGKTAPALTQVVARIASRFNILVTEQAMAKAIPGVGALTGGLINAAFTDHFNSVARYHFGMRALEKQYGDEAVRALYSSTTTEKT